jgi:hypothetical protein
MDDATGTAQTSPKTIASPGLITLVAPAWASRLAVTANKIFRWGQGDLDGTAGDGYWEAQAKEVVDIPVIPGASIVLKPSTNAETIWTFFFYDD